MKSKNIERFFLNTLLRISIFGVLVVLISDVTLYPEDRLSIYIDIAILSASVVAYAVRKKQPRAAVFIITTVVMGAMFYQCIKVPTNTTTSLSILLVVGFIFSVMLKGKSMVIMHSITFLLIHVIFLIQFHNPALRFSNKLNDVVTVSITYSILYFILTYATAVLKEAYDRLNENLHAMNTQLEQLVHDRTQKIQLQNQALIKYSYANAHHLRGPVARLLGLAQISKLDSGVSPQEIIDKMEEQAHEIDDVVRQINNDLEADKKLELIPGKQMLTSLRNTPAVHSGNDYHIIKPMV